MTPPAAPGLLTYQDLALLSALAEDQAQGQAALVPHPALATYLPDPGQPRSSRLGHLAGQGLVRKTDSGGPRSRARTLWLRTEQGTTAWTAWKDRRR